MTHQQLDFVEKSLAGLSALDKLELVERLIHGLRSAATTDRPGLMSPAQPLSEDEFKQHLLGSGLMSRLPLARDTAPRPEFHPVLLDGEPLSATIIRERR